MSTVNCLKGQAFIKPALYEYDHYPTSDVSEEPDSSELSELLTLSELSELPELSSLSELDELEEPDELSELSELLELSELDELSELSELERSESLVTIEELLSLVSSPLPPQYTLITFTARARTKKMIAAAIVALLSIASFVLPAFFWKKLSDEEPEMVCDIWVLVSFNSTTTTIKTQAMIRIIALITSNIPIKNNILQNC